MTTEALMKRCQIGVPRGPNAYDQLHSILAECYGTLGAQATEIDRLQAEVAGLREELEAARQVMRSVRVFVTSREKIKHPEGTEWFDSAVTAIDAALAARKGEA